MKHWLSGKNIMTWSQSPKSHSSNRLMKSLPKRRKLGKSSYVQIEKMRLRTKMCWQLSNKLIGITKRG